MSRAVNAIYARYTDREPFGIDESWLDMTEPWRLFGALSRRWPTPSARAVKAETGLTISVGVSFNKVFAKLGSDYKKPDAVTVIDTENFRRIVAAALKRAALRGALGTKHTGRAGRRNIQTAGRGEKGRDLRAALGAGAGAGHYARGEECLPVRTADERRR